MLIMQINEKIVTVTEARKELYSLVRKSVESYQQVTISSRYGSAKLISKDEYDSLLETLELLSDPTMLKGIQEAEQDITNGQTFTIEEVFGNAKKKLRGADNKQSKKRHSVIASKD